MTLRVDVKKILLVLVIIAAVVAGLAYMFPKKEWSSAMSLRLKVTVTDRHQHVVVPEARVTLKYPPTDLSGQAALDPALFDKTITTGKTEYTGEVVFEHQFGAGGRTSLWGKQGHVILDQNLRVEAPGYQPFEAPLATIVGAPRSFKDRSDIVITIALYPIAKRQP
jgi:hypothetical protein